MVELINKNGVYYLKFGESSILIPSFIATMFTENSSKTVQKNKSDLL